MGRFQTFDWIIDKDEAFYFFKVIRIANQLGLRFAVAKTANEHTTRLKLAVEYHNLEALETFKDHICHRMTFENWQYLSDRHFLYESWLFTPHKNQSQEFAQLGHHLKNIANYSYGFLKLPSALLFPYNMNVYRNEIGSLEELSDLQPLVTKARIPSIKELETTIPTFLSDENHVTYFRDGNYWDAKITIKKGFAFFEAMMNEKDNYALFGLRGDWDVAMSVTQHLANKFGSIVIKSNVPNWQSMVISPLNENEEFNIYIVNLR